MSDTATIDMAHVNRQAGGLARNLFRGGMVTAVVGLTFGLALVLAGERGALLRAYLVDYAFCLSLALGALFFVLLQHLTRAGWSVAVRRLAEVVAATLPALALMGLPLLLATRTLYEWFAPGQLSAAEGQAVLEKSAYLNAGFFVFRYVACFAVLGLLAWYYLRMSVRQDRTGDAGVTRRLQWLSAPAMVLFAFALTVLAIDLLMSRWPLWYSTIFGVYYFAGCVVGSLALLILMAVWLQAAGRLRDIITVDHYHDLGKLLFAFVVFWAYIAFSQYMLIWYGNMPEETVWLASRQSHGWAFIGLALLLGHFLLPFLALLSRVPKRRQGWLAAAAVWLLLMHWLDVYYLVVPHGGTPLAFGLPDLAGALGVGGLFVAALGGRLGQQSLVAERDPRLAESLSFENA